MANIFDIVTVFRPRRTIKSEDHNALQQAVKASFITMGDAPTEAGLRGVSSPFAVGTATAPQHAVTLAALNTAETSVGASVTAAAASAAAASSSASGATTQAGLAEAQKTLATAQASSSAGYASAAASSAAAAAASAITASGYGGGGVDASNNLSELTNFATARTNLGLGSVNNTADADKPVSTAQATAIGLKADSASPTFTGTVSGVTKAHVGLGSVDNTSDANKPVSTAQATAIGNKQTATGVLSGTTASFTVLMEAKLSNISVTQAVDLDAIELAAGTPGLPFTASGAVTAAGKSMQLKSDGTVQQITGQYEAISAGTTLTTTDGIIAKFAYDTTSNIVIRAFINSGNSHLKLYIGTVTGNTIAWGSVLVGIAAATTANYTITWTGTANKFLISYMATGTSLLKAVVCTVASGAVTFGTAITVKDISIYAVNFNELGGWATYDATSGKCILMTCYTADDGVITVTQAATLAYAMTVSGTSVTAGAAFTVLTSVTTNGIQGQNKAALRYVPAVGKVALAYTAQSANTVTNTCFITVTGTTLSLSTLYPTTNAGSPTNSVALGYAPVEARLLVLAASGTEMKLAQYSHAGTVLTVQGTTLTFGAGVVTDSVTRIAVSSDGAVIVVYYKGTSNFIYATTISIAGTVLSNSTVAAVISSARFILDSILLTGQYITTLWTGTSTSTVTEQQHTARFTNFLANSAALLGFSASSAASAATVRVTLLGEVDSSQSGLTVNATYYIGIAGELTTSSTAPNVIVGKALTATKLLITKGI